MFYNSLETVAAIFVMLGIGVYSCHRKWITAESKEFLTKVLVNLCMPAVAIINILERFDRLLLKDIWLLLLIPIIVEVIVIVISNVVGRLLKLTPKRLSLFISMSSLSNAIFVGMPVCVGIFGEDAIPYVMVYYIINTVICWGYSAPLIRMAAANEKSSIKERVKKTLSVPLLSCVLSFVLLLFDFKMPPLFSTVFGFFANCVTPLSILLIARIIYENKINRIRVDLSLVIMFVMRFVISPAAMYFGSVYAGLGGFVSQVYTIQTAMPVMMTTAVLAEAYRSDTEYATSGLVVTTFLSLLIIPVYILLMN